MHINGYFIHNRSPSAVHEGKVVVRRKRVGNTGLCSPKTLLTQLCIFTMRKIALFVYQLKQQIWAMCRRRGNDNIIIHETVAVYMKSLNIFIMR